MGKKAKNKATGQASSSPIGCIIPTALYLAPVSATGNVDLLQREGITHVISIGKNPVIRVEGITYYKFGLLDDEAADLISAVNKVCETLDGILPPPLAPSEQQQEEEEGARERDEQDPQEPKESEEAARAGETLMDMSEQGKTTGTERSPARVLIHCSAAISRSPAVVAGYLMKSRGMCLRESLEVLVNAREVVSPNIGFLRQLCELERQLLGLKEGEKGTFDIDSLKGGGKLRKILGF